MFSGQSIDMHDSFIAQQQQYQNFLILLLLYEK